MAAIDDSKKKRGRGRPETGIGPTIGLRLHPELASDLDAWIEEQPEPKPSKPQAIRTLMQKGLDQS